MPDEREKFSFSEMMAEFDIQRVSLGGPVFDLEKLTWLNGVYIREDLDDDALLQAIMDGHAYGTISQQPWKYGYESVRMLKGILDGDESAIPASKFIDVGYKSVTAKNIDEFWAEKREMAALGAKKD